MDTYVPFCEHQQTLGQTVVAERIDSEMADAYVYWLDDAVNYIDQNPLAENLAMSAGFQLLFGGRAGVHADVRDLSYHDMTEDMPAYQRPVSNWVNGHLETKIQTSVAPFQLSEIKFSVERDAVFLTAFVLQVDDYDLRDGRFRYAGNQFGMRLRGIASAEEIKDAIEEFTKELYLFIVLFCCLGDWVRSFSKGRADSIEIARRLGGRR